MATVHASFEVNGAAYEVAGVQVLSSLWLLEDGLRK